MDTEAPLDSATPGPSQENASGDSGDTPRVPPRAVPRYHSMALILAAEAYPPEDFADVIARHAIFLEHGGGGGRWETIVNTADTDIAIVLGVYAGPEPKQGSQADLSSARLVGLNLRGVQLPYADLAGSYGAGQDLTGANLQGSLLVDSDYRGANFQGANLAGADLSRAELMHCDFRGADLSDADLENADLSDADLRAAALTGAKLPGTILDGVLR